MAVPPDMMAALQGAPPPTIDVPGAPAEGGLPPDMMSSLQGDQEGAGGGGNASAAQHLQESLRHLQLAMDAEPDQVDKASIATCIANLQKVLAKDQQEQDGLLQGKATPSALRGALGGSPA